ncbi:MAG: lipid-transfer protein [Actinomycetota bacterium]
MSLAGRAAIAGIGQTEFSKESGRTEMRLAVEAASAALADAGLSPADVDGFCTFTMDSNEEIELARNLGCGDLSFYSRIHYGGGAACAVIHQAAMAVATGSAEVVIAYRALNGRSWRRFGLSIHDKPTAELIHYSWYTPFGLTTPASWVAMFAQRYMHTYGATSEDLGRVAVAHRAFAATNPDAWFHGKPITLEDHQSSRWIVEPLRLLDCCQESDGGVAVVVTSAERAKDLRQTPAIIRAAAQGSGAGQEEMTSYYRDDLTHLPEVAAVSRQLWRQSGLTPADIQTAVIYDPFTPFVLLQLEEFGFCGPGESKDFVRDTGIGPGGRLPINTNGGQLGEGYIHGMNGVAEGVRQIRGAAANQVPDVSNVLVTAGVGVPTSGIVLSRE